MITGCFKRSVKVLSDDMPNIVLQYQPEQEETRFSHHQLPPQIVRGPVEVIMGYRLSKMVGKEI